MTEITIENDLSLINLLRIPIHCLKNANEWSGQSLEGFVSLKVFWNGLDFEECWENDFHQLSFEEQYPALSIYIPNS